MPISHAIAVRCSQGDCDDLVVPGGSNADVSVPGMHIDGAETLRAHELAVPCMLVVFSPNVASFDGRGS